jgi:glycosyltransferase involved in cell wall biosynthesis
MPVQPGQPCCTKGAGLWYACLKGIEYIGQLPSAPDIVVFIDADYSDHPEEMPQLVQPIID